MTEYVYKTVNNINILEFSAKFIRIFYILGELGMNGFDSFRKFKFFGIPEVMSLISDEENAWKHYQILELHLHRNTQRYEYLPEFLSISGTKYQHRFQPLEYEECETVVKRCIITPKEWLKEISKTYVRNYMVYCKMGKAYCILVYEYPTDEDPFLV